ncbi:hypothetical protein [Sulfurimonas sp.]|uniref:hypothetical protein n=1 Tax=Sulfurimonas sp. TaxID=2022749 RepID=UPI003D0C4961
MKTLNTFIFIFSTIYLLGCNGGDTQSSQSQEETLNPQNLQEATLHYAVAEDFKQASDIDNIWQNDTVMTYEFLPSSGVFGDGVFKATPTSQTDQANTGWNIPNISQADNSRDVLFVSAMYYFSSSWIPAIGAGVKNIDFSLYDTNHVNDAHNPTRIVSLISAGGDWPRFDNKQGVRVTLNRGGAGWNFCGSSADTNATDTKTDAGLFLEDVADMWFWMAYYIDFENNSVAVYVKTASNGPYPEVTRVLYRRNNSVLVGADLQDHAWVKGEIITGQTSGATARVEDYGYDGLIVTPISGDFVDQYDVDYNGALQEHIVGSQSGAWNGLVSASNWNWDRTEGGLNEGAARNILGYWKVDASTAKNAQMYHMLDQVQVGNGWIDPPEW